LDARYLSSGDVLAEMDGSDAQVYIPDKVLEVYDRKITTETLPNLTSDEQLNKEMLEIAKYSTRVVVEIKPDYHHPLLPTKSTASIPDWLEETGDLFTYLNSKYFVSSSNPVAQAVTYACVSRTKQFIIFTLNRITFGMVEFDEEENLKVKLSSTLDCTSNSIKVGSTFYSPWEILIRYLLASQGNWYMEKIPKNLLKLHKETLDRRIEAKNTTTKNSTHSTTPSSEQLKRESSSGKPNSKSSKKSQTIQMPFSIGLLREVVWSELWNSKGEAEMIGYGRTGNVWRQNIQGYDAAFKLVMTHVKREDKENPYIIANELCNEAEIYQQLSKLQGVTIPRLLWYGDVCAGLGMVLITEFAGTPLPEHPTPAQCEAAIRALKSLHRNGILHGDVAKRNFVCQDNVVYILDFGFSKVRQRGIEWLQKVKEEIVTLRKELLE
jgi:tRNA A-37 threonylcarbamoyl transferase component Bud32